MVVATTGDGGKEGRMDWMDGEEIMAVAAATCDQPR